MSDVLKPLTVIEAAGMSGLSRMTITRMFEKEPGVIVLERPESRRKQRYRTIRIPRVVYDRVIKRISIK